MSTAYVDSSFILRALLRELRPPENRNIADFKRLLTSEITEVECRRTIDRIRLGENLPEMEVSLRYSELGNLLRSFDIVPLARTMLVRAGQAFPTRVKTLDAIHLSCALMVRGTSDRPWNFITLDLEQAIAARAVGFVV